MKLAIKKLIAKLLGKVVCTECHKIIFSGGTYGDECDTCWPPMTVKYDCTGKKLF